jgi:hypothetical protein
MIARLLTATGLFLIGLVAGAAADTAPQKVQPKKVRVLLVTSGNLYLDAFFSDRVIGEKATVKRLKPSDLKDEDKYIKPAANGDFDLVVFDCCAPADKEGLPKANTLFIGRPPPPWKLDDMKRVDNPSVKSWAKKHPLLDLPELKDLGIVENYQFKELPKDAERLIEGDRDTVLLMALPRKPHTDLFLTFPLLRKSEKEEELNTDWPLRPSFVVFLGNVVQVVGKGESSSK